MTGLQRVGKGGRELRLDRDDPRLRPERLDRNCDAGDEASAAHRHDDRVEVGHLLEELETDRALAGDDVGIVVGRDRDTAGRALELVGERDRLARRHRGPVESRPVGCSRGRLLLACPCGITSRQSRPCSAAQAATACAWLPEETAMSPRARSSGVNPASLFSTPRGLNDPVRWKSSAFRCSSPVSSCGRPANPRTGRVDEPAADDPARPFDVVEGDALERHARGERPARVTRPPSDPCQWTSL